MKNSISIIIFAILVVFTSLIEAQIIKNYGLKIGLTSANQELSNVNLELERRLGLTTAIFVEWLSLPNFSFMTEIGYTQCGMGVEGVRTDEAGEVIWRGTYDSRLDYLTVPVLAKISLPTGFVKPFISAGFRYDYLLDFDSELPGMNGFYDDFKKSILGGIIGVGIEPKLPLPVHLSLEFRYNSDFTDSHNSSRITAKNNAFDLLLGIAL